ncbi:hypothetical protein [Lacinutrix sp. Hel_I_90]|uniref:kelch repeat-containing protein n=1 Tax=Lacinutrix sp. Hel_I_90 TaxID=1249999 RepID=UPI0005CB5C0C|nr:hypothetical protein [Lacinutrix sp. Hel_I_90]
MKTLLGKPLLKLLLLFIAITTFSCSSDDSADKILPPETLNLTFNLRTNQDQMGDFACKTMIEFNGEIWAIGGDDSYTEGNDYSSAVWKSNDGVAWVSVASNLTGDRCGHTLTVFDGKLWLIGGENTVGDWYGDIWWTTDGANWTNTFVTAPFGAVTYHQTLAFNGKMYVIAGSLITGNTFVQSTVDGNIWVEETNNAFSGRVNQGGFVFDGAMYVLGGENIAGEKLNEIWKSTNGSDWSLLSQNASIFPGLNLHTATVYNNKVWVIGGRTATSTFTNAIYASSNLEDWLSYDGINPLDPITKHATLFYDDALWVFGGYIASGTATGKIWSITED